MTVPQNPGYPAFAPNYAGQGAAPVAPPAPPPSPPWQAPMPQAPQPFMPGQPPAQVPGYAPPPQAPAGYGPPQGYAAPPPQGPPPQQYHGNRWAGADDASLSGRTADIPHGNHLFKWLEFKRQWTSGKKDYSFVHLEIVDSDNPSAKGMVCAFKQNMNPPSQGGANVAFAALSKLVYPALGYDLDANQAEIKAFAAQRKMENWLLELETRNTVEGKPMAGRLFVGQIAPGRRTEKTPPGKDPFPFMNFRPVPAQFNQPKLV